MKFIFTCGGTAGHINPAVAVAGKLKELMPDTEILFIGANNKMEMQLVPREGYEIKGISVGNLRRSFSPEAIAHNFNSVKNVFVSYFDAKRIIKEFKPDAVIGTGGYVCFPVLSAASDLKIPTIVHESNAVPGLTTKMLANKASRILVGFEESRNYYKRPEKIEVTGTPVRGAFDAYTKAEARAKLGLAEGEKLVVSVWGSLGAGHLNAIMKEMIPMLDGKQGFRFVHAAGSAYYKNVMAALAPCTDKFDAMGVEVREYIYDMPCLMAAADLVLCRAGASTISELCYMGKPVIMVPSPNVTNNHQEKNARVLENAGGAKILLEGEFNAASLLEDIKLLLADEEKLNTMSAAMTSLAVPEATDRICEIILEQLK